MATADQLASQLNPIIGRLLTSNDPTEIKQIYAQWAESYDQDLDVFGYVAPQIGANLLAQHFPDKSGRILDAGCGTGLVGEALAQLGYRTIDGADFSAEMLTHAAQTGHYHNLIEIDFFEPIPIDSGTYDAIISIGVYSSRIKTHFIPEMMRVLKPKGVLCLSCRPHYFEAEFREQIARHQRSGLLIIEAHAELPYLQGQNATAHYLILRKM